MSEIPEDILIKSYEIEERISARTQGRIVAHVIAAAIWAERQRCARIAARIEEEEGDIFRHISKAILADKEES